MEPDSLIQALAGLDWLGWFAEARSRNAGRDWRSLIVRAVPPNAFHSFRKTPKPPAAVFRHWACDALFGSEGRFALFQRIRRASEYDSWFFDLVASLRLRWRAEINAQIPFGISVWLASLLMKTVCCSPELSHSIFLRLVWFLHVPLDNACLASLLAGNLGKLPRTGFIDDPATYSAVQEWIAVAAADAGVPPIALDLLAHGAGRRGR